MQDGQLADGGPKAWDRFAMTTLLQEKARRALRELDNVAYETRRECGMKPLQAFQ
jgi:hypothetical protein